MISQLLLASLKPLFILKVLLSVYLLLRGHHLPGGGFIGGLMAASAFILVAIAKSTEDARSILHVSPILLIALGLSFALASGIFPLFVDQPFMTGIWNRVIGTPLVFDIGVYLLVIGFTTLVAFAFFESSESKGDER